MRATRRRVAILGHSAIPHDPRIAKQADVLVRAGYEVDVFGLREQGDPASEVKGALRVIRLPMSRRWRGLVGHLAEYGAFTGMALVVLAREHRRRRYALVQVASPPDFLVAATVPLRALGIPVILDLHEDMPAMFRDRFDRPGLRHANPVVEAVARGSAALADEVVTVHEPLRELVAARGTPRERIALVMNGADETLFDRARFPRRAFMREGELRLIHHSSLHRIYGADVAVEAVSRLATDLPVRLDIYGEGPHAPVVRRTIEALGLADRVRLHGRVLLAELPRLIAGADIGLVPTRAEPYAHLLLSTKLLEYAAMGQRIVASDLATYRAHLTPDAVAYVAPSDPGALADGIRSIVADPALADARAEEAARQAASYSWRAQAERYVALVDRLVSAGPRSRG